MANSDIKISITRYEVPFSEKFAVQVKDGDEVVASATTRTRHSAIRTGKKYSRLYRKHGINLFT